MAITIKITPEMKRKFCSEVAEHLDDFEKMLMVLEKDPANQEAIHAVFRSVHSIKGNCDYIGVKDINTLSHELEDLMDQVRNGSIDITEDVLSLLFEGLDLLRDMNRRVPEDDYEERDISATLEKISNAKGLAREDVFPSYKERDEIDVEAVFARSSLQHMEYIRKVTERILAGETVKYARKSVLRILNTFYNAANYLGVSDIALILEEMKKELEGVRSLSKKKADYLLNRLEEIEKRIAGMGTPEVAGERILESDTELSSQILEREMKVAPEKVDEFMNQVSELTIAKNRLNYLTEKVVTTQVSPEWGHELNKVVANIDKISDGLQADVMKLRLVRINSLFERLPRIVRELSLKSKKKIELSVMGGETEIDRKVIELLIDPLIHLIRNAVEHGIESPGDRSKKNKSESGSLTIKAHQEGNYVIIEVVDDGKGLHVDVIKKAALEKRIVTEEAISSMTDDEIINLIFMPGFSTTPKATRVSGRGVGLDIARNNMKNIGGNVIVESEPDAATRVRLQVPISMAVMDALLAEAAGEQYAFPFSSILESITVKRGEIKVLNKREAVPYYGTVLGLKHLKDILGLTKRKKLRAKGSDEELSVIVITFGGRVRGIVVDRILRREGILAKPLEQHLAGIKEFSGAALLGDGSIVLVLDPVGLF